MAKALATVVALSALVAVAHSCAFVKQACRPEVCQTLDAKKFDDLLNPVSKLFNADQEFAPEDTSRKGDWASVDFKNTLGYFFGLYNPKYNGGKFDASKLAVRDGAPSLNYMNFRTSFGDQVDPEDANTLADCCSFCARTPHCKMYQFNPYITTLYAEDGDTEIGREFREDGSGDCYVLTPTSVENDNIEGKCKNVSAAKVFSITSKPTFLGGYCNSEVNDDPHFVGAHGTRYDFNGALDKAFCLVTDRTLHINTLLRGYQDPKGGETGMRSWMKELGFVWAEPDGQKHTLQLVARAGKQQERGEGFMSRIVLDGALVALPTEAGQSVASGMMQLEYQGSKKVGPYEVDQFNLKIGDLLDLGISMRVAHAKLQTPDDAEVHFNINLNSLKTSPAVHGVLGQTYRSTQSQQLKAIKYSILSRVLGAPVQADGQTGKGFLEGETDDYISSSVLATDCKFSAFA